MTFDEIAGFILEPREIPGSALRMGATLLIDTLGVAAGAEGLEVGHIARNHAVRFMAAGTRADRATLLFDGRQASIPGAGFALASQIDNLDAHDGYNPTKGHIGCAVVPALFAFAEAHPELGAREALAALVMSYEVSARAAVALHATVEDYHTSGAWNALGVAALGCRLKGLGQGPLREALGIAEYHGPRSQMMREIATPTMLHDGSGMGALVGSMAVLLAEDGFTGAPAITVEAPEVAPYWADLGTDWTVERNYIKPYPICRWAHGALNAVEGLMRDHGVTAGMVERLEVRCFSQAAELFRSIPDTTSQAQYSLPFALASMLVHGRLAPGQVMGEGLRDPAVAAMHAKISVMEEPRHSARFPAGRWADVTAYLADGRILKSGDTDARGGPEAPMADAEIEAKFMVMAEALGKDRAARIWAMRDRLLEPGARFAELAEMVTAPV
ncbi:MmgE/PrpD family protein [Marimonas lutisalis]|uniref:MmgE/PrpD family protein n=1 Tax=Marimonas lutisalis TaxID=2545756 RepID=UPI0010F9C236|nr:MmgE/PrpD family protein [Marimonas lutisalis]